jgi:predicted dehydrogenase
MADPRPLNWGILGTGMIARKFAKAVVESATAKLHSIGSRNAETARGFAEAFGAERSHASYKALLRDPDVEAVYISLPNHMHAEWTARTASAGKHVLCEKPFTVNEAEARNTLDTVRKSRVFFMEAFMYRCHPQTKMFVDLIKDGAIGEVRLIHASFAYDMGLNYENIRLSKPAAGGGIMDVGCYTLSMCRLIAGAARNNPFQNPSTIRGVAHIGEISQVDQQAAAVLKFPGGIVAQVSAATQVACDNSLRVYGSGGSLTVPIPWAPPEGTTSLTLKSKDRETRAIEIESTGSLYTYEIDLLAQCIRKGDREAPPPAMTWADTIGNMAALDTWRREVGLLFAGERS